MMIAGDLLGFIDLYIDEIIKSFFFVYYLKLGIYRHKTIGYWNSDWESLPDQTVYYDNIVFRKPKKDEKIKNK